MEEPTCTVCLDTFHKKDTISVLPCRYTSAAWVCSVYCVCVLCMSMQCLLCVCTVHECAVFTVCVCTVHVEGDIIVLSG